MFIHQDPEFAALLEIVAGRVDIPVALVEKDYWVTHTLWAIQDAGLAAWFKGGTSLSKGFELIQRFSEDLDLHLDRGACVALPEVTNWRSGNKGPVALRRKFYEALPGVLQIPGARLRVESIDEKGRGACYQVLYEGRFLGQLDPVNSPYVKLEVGYADVLPNIPVDLGSFVHGHLAGIDRLAAYTSNLPRGFPTVHPLVTLIEKLEAIVRRFPRDPFEPASFARHYEDAVHVIRQQARLPPLDQSPRDLGVAMLKRGQVGQLPRPEDPAFLLDDQVRRQDLERSLTEIGPMFWGPRVSLHEACRIIREWLQQALG